MDCTEGDERPRGKLDHGEALQTDLWLFEIDIDNSLAMLQNNCQKSVAIDLNLKVTS